MFLRNILTPEPYELDSSVLFAASLSRTGLIEPKDAPIVAGALAANCEWIATFDRKHPLSEAAQIHRLWDIMVDEPGAIIPRLELPIAGDEPFGIEIVDDH